MSSVSRQRERYDDALQLSQEASASLQPLHDDLAELTPAFDGFVYFAKDRWHKNNASAVAAVQPRSNDDERFSFYKHSVDHRRVDLGSTALGQGLQLADPAFIPSRMNPDQHITWTHRTIINDELSGGLQAAFNAGYGHTPASTDTINKIWRKHESTVLDVASSFDSLSKEVGSIGDTLELLSPATPNAYILSWDLRNSTPTAFEKYGTLRNYLLDTKSLFNKQLEEYRAHTHDTGDGQDVAIWIPETSVSFNRASKEDLRGFGKTRILPLIDRLMQSHNHLAESYPDLAPTINFAVGLGYVEHDLHNERTSQAYWENAQVLSNHPESAVNYTERARELLSQDTDDV